MGIVFRVEEGHVPTHEQQSGFEMTSSDQRPHLLLYQPEPHSPPGSEIGLVNPRAVFVQNGPSHLAARAAADRSMIFACLYVLVHVVSVCHASKAMGK